MGHDNIAYHLSGANSMSRFVGGKDEGEAIVRYWRKQLAEGNKPKNRLPVQKHRSSRPAQPHNSGTCKPGERSDLTGCTPAVGTAGTPHQQQQQEAPASRFMTTLSVAKKGYDATVNIFNEALIQLGTKAPGFKQLTSGIQFLRDFTHHENHKLEQKYGAIGEMQILAAVETSMAAMTGGIEALSEHVSESYEHLGEQLHQMAEMMECKPCPDLVAGEVFGHAGKLMGLSPLIIVSEALSKGIIALQKKYGEATKKKDLNSDEEEGDVGMLSEDEVKRESQNYIQSMLKKYGKWIEENVKTPPKDSLPKK
jgi:hypothetical protein